MGRLIDADALAKAVEKEHIFIRPYDDPFDVVREQGARLKKCVMNAPTVEVPRWIPVTERLPDKNKRGLGQSISRSCLHGKLCHPLDAAAGATEGGTQ